MPAHIADFAEHQPGFVHVALCTAFSQVFRKCGEYFRFVFFNMEALSFSSARMRNEISSVAPVEKKYALSVGKTGDFFFGHGCSTSFPVSGITMRSKIFKLLSVHQYRDGIERFASLSA